MNSTTPREPLDDTRLDQRPLAPDPRSAEQEKVDAPEDIGTVASQAYPASEREDIDVTAANNRGKRAVKRGSGPVTGSGAGAGEGGNPEDYDNDVQAGGGHKPIRTNTGPKTGADAPIGGSR